MPRKQCCFTSKLFDAHSAFEVQVIGVLGPLPGDKKYAMELKPPQDMGWFHQSVAFVVL